MKKQGSRRERDGAYPFIPLSVPTPTGREAGYLEECVRTNWVSYAGPFVDRFELQLAEAAGALHAVATTSGTAALHCALILAGVREGSEVLMPGITFVAAANAVRYCGAAPVFFDLEDSSWQMDVDALESFLTNQCERRDSQLINRFSGREVKAVLAVHLLGGLADIQRVAGLCSRFGLFLVEDAAEALGCEYSDGKLASPLAEIDCDRRILATSFNGNKIITTGGGGAILTNDPVTARRARHLTTTAKCDPIQFDHDELGYNYRMSNITAAFGVAQLESLDEYVSKKRAIAKRYDELLDGNSHIAAALPERPGVKNSYWLYTVLLKTTAMPIVRFMERHGVQTRPLWKPMPDLNYLEDFESFGDLPFGRLLQNRAISLPCSVSLPLEDQDRVVETLLRALAD